MTATRPTRRMTIMDGAGNAVNINGTFGSLVTDGVTAHQIDRGNHFFVSGYTEIDTDATLTFCVTTNATNTVHMTWAIETSAKAHLVVYEGSAISGGSAVTAYNSNRQSSNTSSLTIVSGPTVNTTGTLIASSGMGGATRNFISGGDATRNSELILSTSTIYQWTITSDADNNVIDYVGSWIEE